MAQVAVEFKAVTPRLLLRFLAVFIVFLILIVNAQKSPKTSPDTWMVKAQDCNQFSDKNSKDKCFRNILSEATKELGAQRAIEVLSELRKKNIITAEFDDHLHVHEIGRALAESRDVNVDAFLSCPTTYNYGCQHGFFEYALSKTSSPSEAATLICEDLPSDSPVKLYYYCYHGVGHGLMMAFAYNLQKSLDTCDKLPNQRAQEGCLQGVLMENGNVAVSDPSLATGFSSADPLSPCNKMVERYQWQCFINHAGYLMKITNLDLVEAAKICLTAPTPVNKQACIQSLGLMVTNPLWQKSVAGVDTVSNAKRNVEVSWQMCEKLPSESQKDCIIGAVGNIHNFDETGILRSSLFCDLVSQNFREICFREIGKQVVAQAKNLGEAVRVCHKIEKKDDNINCLLGAGSKGAIEAKISEVDEKLIFENDQNLKDTIKSQGIARTIELLANIAPKYDLSCHDRAHVAGRFAYEIVGSEAFSKCSSLCHAGCYHGAAEAFFADRGTAELQENLSLLCPQDTNQFFSHQCLHGVGHGLMAWANYELFDALLICDGLQTEFSQSSCYTGVFMENIVGGLAQYSGHYTKYLNKDPHYPCNEVPEKYKGECYFLQTSRMIQLFNSDFKKIAQECTRSPTIYQRDCFQSMGRDAGGTSKPNVELAMAKCQFAPYGEARSECLSGAVQDFFWDPSGQGQAIYFCSLLKDPKEIKRCWETITIRAGEVLISSDNQEFCKNIPTDIDVYCKSESQNVSNLPYSESLKKNILSLLSILDKVEFNLRQNDVVVKIQDSGFVPRKLTIKKGTKVIFKNQDGANALHWPASNIHPTHLVYPEFDAQKPLKKDEAWEFVFQKSGIWYYHDHLYSSITGVITVE